MKEELLTSTSIFCFEAKTHMSSAETFRGQKQMEEEVLQADYQGKAHVTTKTRMY